MRPMSNWVTTTSIHSLVFSPSISLSFCFCFLLKCFCCKHKTNNNQLVHNSDIKRDKILSLGQHRINRQLCNYIKLLAKLFGMRLHRFRSTERCIAPISFAFSLKCEWEKRIRPILYKTHFKWTKMRSLNAINIVNCILAAHRNFFFDL